MLQRASSHHQNYARVSYASWIKLEPRRRKMCSAWAGRGARISYALYRWMASSMIGLSPSPAAECDPSAGPSANSDASAYADPPYDLGPVP